MHRLFRLVPMLRPAAFLPMLLHAPIAFAQTANIDSVWAREQAYWRYLKAGDVKDFVSLFNDRFVGWPSDTSHPATKAKIENYPRQIAGNKIEMSYVLTKEGGQDFGDIVVIYYRAKEIYKYADGHTDPEDELRLTHTWMRVGSDWEIIGGMGASLPSPP